MKMKIKMLLTIGLFSSLMLPLKVQAGTEMHGGDSVVCFQNIQDKIKVEAVLRQNKLAAQMGAVRLDPFADIDLNAFSVETLDIWETRQATIPPKDFIEVSNINSAVEERIKILGKKVTTVADATMDAYKGFYHPSKWLASSTGIVEIDDSHELINYTKSCIPVQIAVQTNTRVYYDARLYAKLDPLNKAALILHELMYSWMKNHSNNSFNVRKYVGLLMLNEFENYSYEELFNEINTDFNYKVEFRKYFDCEKKLTLEDVVLKVIFRSHLLNPDECLTLSENDKSGFSSIDQKDLKLLEEKIGVKLSEVHFEWINGNREFSNIRLKSDQWLELDTVVPTAFLTQYDYGWLSVEDKKIVKNLPEKGTIKLLNQEIALRDMKFEKKSDKNFLSSGILTEKDMLFKSTTGFKKTKSCRVGSRVHFNSSGLMVNCTEE